jgi:hypothetical protein
MKQALYFGFLESHGHGMIRSTGWRNMYDIAKEVPGFPEPWIGESGWFVDGGLLKNGQRPDVYDGKVFAVPAYGLDGNGDWIAFVWWDRSGDKRSNSNSGLYVQGFVWAEREAAWTYGCEQFPKQIARQRVPLVLVDRNAD